MYVVNAHIHILDIYLPSSGELPWVQHYLIKMFPFDNFEELSADCL